MSSFSPAEVEILTRAGDFLDGIDEVRERNEVGFNQIDKHRWPLYRGHAQMMARVLSKYRRQLVGAFGEEIVTILEKAPQAPTVQVEVLETKYGPAAYFRAGFIPSNVFDRYRTTLKDSGLWFDGESKSWFVPSKSMNGFNFKAVFEKLVNLNFEVAEEGQADAVEASKGPRARSKPTSAAEARNLIASNQIHNAISIRQLPTGKYEVRYTFSKRLNEFFSNKSGQLTSITEFNPETKARETFDTALILEVIDKIRGLLAAGGELEGWTLYCDEEQQYRAALDAQVAANAQAIPEVAEKLAPGFALFPYQNEMVSFFDESDGCVLVGDETGLGKTLQALAWIAARGKRALIVGPKVTRRNWINEAKKFFPSQFHDLNVIELSAHNKNKVSDLSMIRIASVNYDSLEKFLPVIQTAGFDTLVCDESHKLKDPRTKTYAVVSSIANIFQHRILMSGTAIKNKREELFTQVHIVRPGFFESSAEIRAMSIGKMWTTLNGLYKARTKAAVLSQLPSKTMSVMELEVSGAPDFDPLVGLPFEECSALKAALAVAKAPSTISYVREILETSDECVLVFTDSVEAAKQIAQELGEDAILHHGQLQDNLRENLKAGFQNESLKQRVFVTTRQSLAVGATLTRASRVVFNDLPWTAADIKQAEDRCLLEGQLVLTKEDGYVPIEAVQVGQHVWTHLGRWKKITDHWSKEHRGVVVEIEYMHCASLPLVCTDNHEVLVLRNDRRCWVRADDIKMTDLLVTPAPKGIKDISSVAIDQSVSTTFKNNFQKVQTNGRYKRINQIDLTPDALFLMGWYVADGFAHTGKDKGRFVSWCDENKHIKKFERLFKFADDLGINIHKRVMKKATEVRFYSADLASFFEEHFGKNAYEKKVPDWVMSLNQEGVRSFFEGYISGDGYVRGNQVEWTSVSSRLAVQIGLLAIKAGNGFSIRRAEQAKSWVGGISTTVKTDGEFSYHPIRSIKLDKRKVRVWDISVEQDESFLTGNCIVHNCHRISQKNAVTVNWIVAADNNFDDRVSNIIRRKYELHKLANEGKQLTPEEREWCNKEVSWSDIINFKKRK